MRTTIGAPYRVHLRSVFHTDEGGVRLVTITDSQNDVFFSRTCVQSLCKGTYFDGTTLYRVDFNRTALPDSQRDAPVARSMHVVESLEFLGAAFRGTIADGGTTTLDASLCRTLLITPRDGITMAVAVDVRTALPAWVSDARDRANPVYLSDYKRVGAFLLPFTMHEGTTTERFAAREVESRPFSPPSGLAVQLTGNPAMQTDPSRATPLGACTLAGVAARCLIDTGTSGMSLSLQLAERLALPIVGGGDARGLGTYATEVVRAGPLAVGNALVPPANYTVLTDIDRYGYDVIVGTDALAATRVLVDPATHLVRFGVAASHDATILPLSFSDFVPLVDVHLGDIVASLLLDTGDESGIDLSSDFYTAHPDAFVPTQERSVAGVGGESTELLGRAPYVELGGLTLRDQPIGTTRSPIGAVDGRLGAGFLRQFPIVLDYANRRVELLKSTATQANGAPTSYP